jgi:Dolichyl-phosphate-mannose-protein mannosyltransferase
MNSAKKLSSNESKFASRKWKFFLVNKSSYRIFSLISILIFITNGIWTSRELLIDLHAFRQTQTAIGVVPFNLSLLVPTPVLGYPWAVPFEFPLYQWLVYYVHSLVNGLSIDTIGRLTNVFLTVVLIYQVKIIVNFLGLSREIFYFFSIILATSPQYIYWGRSFLIEIFSLNLTISALYYFLKTLRVPNFRNFFFLTLFLMGSMLVKITTSFAVCLLILSIFTFKVIIGRNLKYLNGIALVFVSSLVFLAWIKYTDTIKNQGVISFWTNSSNLRGWNFGTLNQRFSSSLWRDVFLNNIILGNLGAGLGALIIIYSFLKYRYYLRYKITLVILTFLPLLIFTNLHIVHIYYQTGILIYLFLLLSLAMFQLHLSYPNIVKLVTIFLIISNLLIFRSTYWPYETIRPNMSQDYLIALEVKNLTKQDEIFLAAGKDWSPVIPYYAKREAIMLPDWIKLNKGISLKELAHGKKVSLILDCAGVNNPSAREYVATQIYQLGFVSRNNIGGCNFYTK